MVSPQKLSITKYNFVYSKEELNNGVLEYSIEEMMRVEYVDGKRNGESYSPVLYFSLSAEDHFFNTFTFSFELNISLEELNTFSKEPSIISKYVVEGETFLNNPYESHCGGPMFLSLEERIDSDNPRFLVSKIEENKFIFKVSIPEEIFFCWFKVDFNEKSV